MELPNQLLSILFKRKVRKNQNILIFPYFYVIILKTKHITSYGVNLQSDSKMARQALRRSVELAEQNNLNSISMDEINAEVKTQPNATHKNHFPSGKKAR
jgi:hypothetical protein